MAQTKKKFLLLTVVYLSFLALGMPDGALGVAWTGIRYEMHLPLQHAQVIFMTQALCYALMGSLSGRIAGYFKLEHMNFAGLVLMSGALLGFSLAPNFIVLALMAMPLGFGMGLIDSSLNSYVAKHFSSRVMGFLHCFWGVGASISPILMSQMILLFHWRSGYVALATIQAIVVVLVFISLLRGIWRVEDVSPVERLAQAEHGTPHLMKKRFQYFQMGIFFLYTGAEASINIWTPSVLMESRGMEIGIAGLYPAVYLGGITVGRFLSGYFAERLSNITMIRLGFYLSFAGLGILIFSSNILGMALTGLGFAPIFPCLMHETPKRFSPAILTKLVGYQIAAVGTGVALLSAFTGQILSRISLEALYPLVLGLIVCAFLVNEVIEKAMIKQGAA